LPPQSVEYLRRSISPEAVLTDAFFIFIAPQRPLAPEPASA
jgi:hypothetical protein